jgi:hypothetical protein
MANIKRSLQGAYRELFVGSQLIRKAPNGNYVFIHINRTGSTKIARMLGMPTNQYLTVQEIIDNVGKEKWENAFKFVFIRNPFSKVVSQYNYRFRINQTNLKVKQIPFKEWVKKTYGKEKDLIYYDKPKMFMPQVNWLKNYMNELDVDYIGRFERIHTDFNIICSMLGVYKKLPYMKNGSRADYLKFYDEETLEIVYDWFQEDFDTFRYRFDWLG